MGYFIGILFFLVAFAGGLYYGSLRLRAWMDKKPVSDVVKEDVKRIQN